MSVQRLVFRVPVYGGGADVPVPPQVCCRCGEPAIPTLGLGLLCDKTKCWDEWEYWQRFPRGSCGRPNKDDNQNPNVGGQNPNNNNPNFGGQNPNNQNPNVCGPNPNNNNPNFGGPNNNPNVGKQYYAHHPTIGTTPRQAPATVQCIECKKRGNYVPVEKLRIETETCLRCIANLDAAIARSMQAGEREFCEQRDAELARDIAAREQCEQRDAELARRLSQTWRTIDTEQSRDHVADVVPVTPHTDVLSQQQPRPQQQWQHAVVVQQSPTHVVVQQSPHQWSHAVVARQQPQQPCYVAVPRSAQQQWQTCYVAEPPSTQQQQPPRYTTVPAQSRKPSQSQCVNCGTLIDLDLKWQYVPNLCDRCSNSASQNTEYNRTESRSTVRRDPESSRVESHDAKPNFTRPTNASGMPLYCAAGSNAQRKRDDRNSQPW